MSGGGGGGYTTQQSTSSSSSGPPTEIAWMLNNLAGQAYGSGNFEAPDLYSGSMTADLSTQTQNALNAASNRLNYTSPVLNSANKSVTDTLSGKYLNLESNPYFFSGLEASLRPQQEQFLNETIPGITSAFTGSGRTASGLHQEVVQNATKDFNRAQADARAKAASEAYTSERGLMSQAAGQASSLASTASNIDMQNIEAALKAGQITDQQAQKLIDEQVYRYNYDQNKDLNYLTNVAQQIQSIYPGGTTTGSNYSYGQTMKQSNTLSDLLSAITGGAGLGLSAYSAFSDERLKEDIKPVGKLHDGQTVYSYRFLGSPKTEIGLLAQEVARKHPEAVHVDPGSGFLKVDYRRATVPSGGLL